MNRFSNGLLAASLGLLVSLNAVAGGHNQMREEPVAMNQELTAEIDAALNEYEELWDKQDPAGLMALWDQADAEPFYLAEEQDEWRIGWEQLKDYWAPSGPANSRSIRMRFDGVQARLLAEDLAFAKFWIRFDTDMKFLPAPIGTDARASAIFRKTDKGWRLITWAESPMSPILYVQKLYKQHREEGEESPMPYIQTLYERHAREDFPAFMEDHSRDIGE